MAHTELRLLTAEEVARILRVSKARVYELARRGIIPSVRLGYQVRFSEAALREWIARSASESAYTCQRPNR